MMSEDDNLTSRSSAKNAANTSNGGVATLELNTSAPAGTPSASKTQASPTSPTSENDATPSSVDNIRRTVCTNPEVAQVAAKMESIKNSIMTKFKVGKQAVFENLGKVEKTIDTDMESRVNALNDLHARYTDVYKAARAFGQHHAALIASQRQLAESFYQLSLRELDLKAPLTEHSETLRQCCAHDDAFSKTLGFFVSSLETLCMKTIKDTLLTVQMYENARLEYDAHRQELTTLQQQSDLARKSIDELQAKVESLKARYEQLKEDVRVKIALLDENRIKVLRAQLAQFEKGITSSFAASIKSLKQLSPTNDDAETNFVRGVASTSPPSFLEH